MRTGFHLQNVPGEDEDCKCETLIPCQHDTGSSSKIKSTRSSRFGLRSANVSQTSIQPSDKKQEQRHRKSLPGNYFFEHLNLVRCVRRERALAEIESCELGGPAFAAVRSSIFLLGSAFLCLQVAAQLGGRLAEKKGNARVRKEPSREGDRNR